MGFFQRLKQGLTKTRGGLTNKVDELVKNTREIDEDFYEELTDILILADVGVAATTEIIEKLQQEVEKRGVKDADTAKDIFKQILVEEMNIPRPPLKWPMVMFVVGVNGVGKTTTIGKMALRFQEIGRSVMLAAADTFRQMGYRIKIFDAYRPQDAVRHFVRWSEDGNDTRMQAEFYPEFRKKSLLVDQGYIARNSSHMRGSAVDLTLTDMDGNELDMGTCFDYFGKKAWHDAVNVTPEQKENRELLKAVMEANGFKAFEQEWWHYRLKDEPYKTEKFNFPVK